MDQLGIKASTPRKTNGSLNYAAKLVLKGITAIEEWRGSCLGIDGKLALWRALETVAEIEPELEKVDYHRLISRAQEQRQVAEAMRLMAALALVPQRESRRPAALR